MFDVERTVNDLISWLRSSVDLTQSVVIGISGGKDSAIAAAVCAAAIGEDNVIGVIMPNGTQADIKDAYYIVNHLNIPHITVDVSRSVTNIQSELIDYLDELHIDRIPNTAKSKMTSRIRTDVLHMIADSINAIVINPVTTTKTMVGACEDTLIQNTLFPFINLSGFKVKEIGRYLSVPEFIINKPSRIDTCGESIELKLGFTLDEADKIIDMGWVEINELADKDDVSDRNVMVMKKLIEIDHDRNKETVLDLISSMLLSCSFYPVDDDDEPIEFQW